jgi:Regulator of chromosome condensation (RCC1) repeat
LLLNDGSMLTFGSNKYGQLGVGNRELAKELRLDKGGSGGDDAVEENGEENSNSDDKKGEDSAEESNEGSD